MEGETAGPCCESNRVSGSETATGVAERNPQRIGGSRGA